MLQNVRIVFEKKEKSYISYSDWKILSQRKFSLKYLQYFLFYSSMRVKMSTIELTLVLQVLLFQFSRIKYPNKQNSKIAQFMSTVFFTERHMCLRQFVLRYFLGSSDSIESLCK